MSVGSSTTLTRRSRGVVVRARDRLDAKHVVPGGGVEVRGALLGGVCSTQEGPRLDGAVAGLLLVAFEDDELRRVSHPRR
ncbi:hypothetical protein [Halorussus marinus]|uniref:hypothetical protein n=1 Tax=Halorussus marinus TaxID=2505976 RepID=UPI0014305786|nr:hypothetical protein [Halorussus marinus]